ncbi:helix-turn-helix transcriptional regulator [Viridibacillus sp. YIM B01967]|uniref:Helix-turn-helix transcriptional regulator n=1 Tax=Viridibacillus soli TaxID=2798301 RepID=A0ABS1H3H8_9BACL|nr:helix-turn-helix transcriptional regulator [Viridibacillus soli]MBK3493975.1 helix-turn-helix transcriptional regulator [Viridibacillus soli]
MNNNIIEEINKWLTENDFTQKQFAEKLGVSDSLIGAILKGQRRITTQRITQIANIMGKTVSELKGKRTIEEQGYMLQLRGHATSRKSKIDVQNIVLAIQDCERLKIKD